MYGWTLAGSQCNHVEHQQQIYPTSSTPTTSTLHHSITESLAEMTTKQCDNEPCSRMTVADKNYCRMCIDDWQVLHARRGGEKRVIDYAILTGGGISPEPGNMDVFRDDAPSTRWQPELPNGGLRRYDYDTEDPREPVYRYQGNHATGCACRHCLDKSEHVERCRCEACRLQRRLRQRRETEVDEAAGQPPHGQYKYCICEICSPCTDRLDCYCPICPSVLSRLSQTDDERRESERLSALRPRFVGFGPRRNEERTQGDASVEMKDEPRDE